MTAFVLDCSVTMSWCFQDEARPETDALLERLRDDGAIVPQLWFWEVANVLNMAVRRKRINAAGASAQLGVLATLPIAPDPDGVAQAWRETLRLAQAEGLTVYDASYLELAMRIGADLATTDADLRAAAVRLGVTVVP
jgi:predicted nucleic acid-binding protein